jgi:hypothetical protein
MPLALDCLLADRQARGQSDRLALVRAPHFRVSGFPVRSRVPSRVHTEHDIQIISCAPAKL